jgi:murein peptide amidase A
MTGHLPSFCRAVLRYTLTLCSFTLLLAQMSSAMAASPAPHDTRITCKTWSQKLPGISETQCKQLGLTPSGTYSVQRRSIDWRDVQHKHIAEQTSSVAEGASVRQRKVLVLGGIHGDELSSSSLALVWLQLALNYTAHTEPGMHWRFIPMLNPDGLLSRPTTRTNAHGIDLNRNFPTPNWQGEARAYWEKRTKKDKRRYPGSKPLSEPESKFIDDQIHGFAPDLIVSIHAPLGVLDFDGPPNEGYVPPSKLGRLYLDQVGIYPGSLGHYAGVHKGIPVVTVELPHAMRVPQAAEVRQMWLDLLRWMDERLPRK